jgi:type I restriction enzyme S subunit
MVLELSQFVPGLGYIPTDWNVKTADEVNLKITKGTTPPKAEIIDSKEIPFLRVNNLGFNGVLNKNSDFIFVSRNAHEGVLARSKAYPGDILMNIVGPPLGKVSLLGNDFAEYNMNQAIVIYRLIDEVIYRDFFLAYLLSDIAQQWLQSRSKKTSGQQNLTIELCKALPVPVPAFKEQTKIAQILSTWDQAITTTERLLDLARQQKKALMQQLLTGKKRFPGFEGEWRSIQLGDVFDKVSNGVTYDASNLEGLPVTRIETISNGTVNFEKVGWAPDEDNTRRFKLESGDILYSHINSLEHIGRVAYFNDERPLYHGMNLLLLRTKKNHDSLFLFHLLNSQVGKKYAKSYAKSAVNQASISTTDVKTFKVYLPEIEEQQQIAKVLSAADQEIETLQSQLDGLKQEKKALMQALLTGKRRVQIN